MIKSTQVSSPLIQICFDIGMTMLICLVFKLSILRSKCLVNIIFVSSDHSNYFNKRSMSTLTQKNVHFIEYCIYKEFCTDAKYSRLIHLLIWHPALPRCTKPQLSKHAGVSSCNKQNEEFSFFFKKKNTVEDQHKFNVRNTSLGNSRRPIYLDDCFPSTFKQLSTRSNNSLRNLTHIPLDIIICH